MFGIMKVEKYWNEGRNRSILRNSFTILLKELKDERETT